MKIISPRSFISASTTSPFTLTLDELFFPTKANISVSLEFCKDTNFSASVTAITPHKITIGSTSITNGTVGATHKGKRVIIQHTYSTVAKMYLRVKVSQNGKNYYSNVISISTESGGGTIISKTVPKNFCPQYISFHDIYEIVGNSSDLNIRVEVCNNALDAGAVWEDATTEYISKEPYKFKNKNKTASKFAVKVRMTLTKSSPGVTFNLYKMQFIVT